MRIIQTKEKINCAVDFKVDDVHPDIIHVLDLRGPMSLVDCFKAIQNGLLQLLGLNGDPGQYRWVLYGEDEVPSFYSNGEVSATRLVDEDYLSRMKGLNKKI